VPLIAVARLYTHCTIACVLQIIVLHVVVYHVEAKVSQAHCDLATAIRTEGSVPKRTIALERNDSLSTLQSKER